MAHVEMRNGPLSLDRILQLAFGLLLGITMGIQSWVLVTTIEQGERIVAIEANRFTAADGTAMLSRLTIPPKWFELTVRNQGETQKNHQRLLEKLDERLDRIEDKLESLMP